MKIALFHYHLKPGGVTDVIVFSVRALLSHLDEISELRLVTGAAENSAAVLDRIRDGLNRTKGDKLRLDVLEEVGYTEEGQEPEIPHLLRKLEARYGEDTLWWVHNYHLGKNPAFTSAIMSIAESRQQNLLLHIHDFPECGRHENLRRLAKVMKTPPYPSGPHIRYAVINERDRRILAATGLESSVSLLANPVSLDTPDSPRAGDVRAAMVERCAAHNPGFLPDALMLLYPVRAIRRKNILEAALLVRLLENTANLVLTLPGVSSQEKAYSDLVESAYREGLIPGVWCPEATGDERLTYSKLAAASDAVISTSVQEGFGYLFLNALHWRKPLLARYLDILDGILGDFGDYPRRFWADFPVPVSADLRKETQDAYRRKLAGLAASLPDKSVKSINLSIEKMGSNGTIDISYLAPEAQIGMLRLAKDDESWRGAARSLNKELLDSAGRTLKARAPNIDSIIERRYGESTYVQTFAAVAASFGRKSPVISPVKIRDAVSKTFGRIDYLRLLYDA